MLVSVERVGAAGPCWEASGSAARSRYEDKSGRLQARVLLRMGTGVAGRSAPQMLVRPADFVSGTVSATLEPPRNTPEPDLMSIDPEQIERVYSNYAVVYDRVFGRVFQASREAVVRNLKIDPGERV